jgi:hypothetical protein
MRLRCNGGLILGSNQGFIRKTRMVGRKSFVVDNVAPYHGTQQLLLAQLPTLEVLVRLEGATWADAYLDIKWRVGTSAPSRRAGSRRPKGRHGRKIIRPSTPLYRGQSQPQQFNSIPAARAFYPRVQQDIAKSRYSLSRSKSSRDSSIRPSDLT